MRILRVEEPAGDDDAAPIDSQRPHGDHLGIDGRFRPVAQNDLLRSGRHRRRGDALGNEVEDAGVIQIAEEGGVEGGFECRSLRILRGGREIGGGDADLGGAEVGAGTHPVLGTGGRRSPGQSGGRNNQKSQREKSREKTALAYLCHAFLMLLLVNSLCSSFR